MPTIEFEGVGLAADKIAEAPDGGDLVDICDRVLAPIPFSCRSASCGTCHIDILEGAEPWLPQDPAAFRVRSVSALLDKGVPFDEGLRYMAMSH